MTTISMNPATPPAMPRARCPAPTTKPPLRGLKLLAWLPRFLPGWRQVRATPATSATRAAPAARAEHAAAYQVPLPHATMRHFERPLGLRLSCVRGSLWITVDGEAVDHVLAAGDAFEPASHRRIIAYALEDAVLRVQPSPA